MTFNFKLYEPKPVIDANGGDTGWLHSAVTYADDDGNQWEAVPELPGAAPVETRPPPGITATSSSKRLITRSWLMGYAPNIREPQSTKSPRSWTEILILSGQPQPAFSKLYRFGSAGFCF